MDLISELEKTEEEDLIEILKNETLPLVMWGAGSSASEVSQYLRQNGIILADVFVDDQFYSEGAFFEGRPILSYTMLKEKFELVNVIIGNTNYERIEDLKSMEGVCNVFCLFSMSYNVYDKTPISVVEKNLPEFERAYNCLEDELSRKNFIAFLKTRVSGNNKYILEVFNKEMNFFSNDVFSIGSNEIYLDVGAFTGDTIQSFIKENGGKYKHIYALEPDYENYIKLDLNLQKSKIKNFSIKRCGAWNEKGILKFYSSGKQVSSVLGDNNENKEFNTFIEVDKLDNAFDYMEKVTLLKINYFLGVVETLEGARNILQKHSPKLVITVGFDCRNIRNVPIMINNINSSYRLFLRFNRGATSALTLYGMV